MCVYVCVCVCVCMYVCMYICMYVSLMYVGVFSFTGGKFGGRGEVTFPFHGIPIPILLYPFEYP